MYFKSCIPNPTTARYSFRSTTFKTPVKVDLYNVHTVNNFFTLTPYRSRSNKKRFGQNNKNTSGCGRKKDLKKDQRNFRMGSHPFPTSVVDFYRSKVKATASLTANTYVSGCNHIRAKVTAKTLFIFSIRINPVAHNQKTCESQRRVYDNLTPTIIKNHVLNKLSSSILQRNLCGKV